MGLLPPQDVDKLNKMLNRQYQRAEVQWVDSDTGMVTMLVSGPRGHQSQITLTGDQYEEVQSDGPVEGSD